MNERIHVLERCGECGLVVNGGTDGCRAVFNQVAVPTPGANPYLPFRRLIVDTYSLQHPDPYCVSATSLAAHLTGVAWILEYRDDLASGSDQIRRWLNSKPRIRKPVLPASYGELRIDSVAGGRTSEDIARAVDGWARSTWSAYASLQAIAREWIEQALAYRGHAR